MLCPLLSLFQEQHLTDMLWWRQVADGTAKLLKAEKICCGAVRWLMALPYLSRLGRFIVAHCHTFQGWEDLLWCCQVADGTAIHFKAEKVCCGALMALPYFSRLRRFVVVLSGGWWHCHTFQGWEDLLWCCQVADGTAILVEAEKTQKQGRAMLCIIGLVALIVVMLIVVIVKQSMSRKAKGKMHTSLLYCHF
jgi:hypothetical protein